MLINGVPGSTISVLDRGLQYGDGVFRTMLVRQGRVLNWRRHYEKLRSDCLSIRIKCPDEQLLHDELLQLTPHQADTVAKIIVTRGASARGYSPTDSAPTRIVTAQSAPSYPLLHAQQGVRLHVCELRLSHQPRLAGVKHLNRLENVLASAELTAPDIAEGLLLDEAGNVIEGTRTNLFFIKSGELFTPDLSQCGVAGVQRERVLDWAAQSGVACRIGHFSLKDVQAADEIFLVNSIIGLWPVREMPGYKRELHPISRNIQEWLTHEDA